jgi:iron complex outermembrane recepter protein
VSRPAGDSEHTGSVIRWLACVVLGSLVGSWAHDARADTTLSTPIRPQAVADALAAFAHQTGLQFIYVSSIARARMSKGAPAGMAPAAALPALLDGTGLGFEYLNSRTVRIFEAPAVRPPQSPAAGVPMVPAMSRTPTAGKSEEIVVTGNRGLHAFGDAEDIQHVAASVSVASGDTLEAQKLGQLGDYAAYLPALNIDTGGVPSFLNVQLRGIGEVSSPMVAYYVDDTPIRPNWLPGSFAWPTPDLIPYDLERIEVRRGPQGTQGGAGSEVGLIRYVLREPDAGAFEANVGTGVSTTRYASQPGTSVQGMVNVPIVKDVLAIRASGYDVYTPGFIDNVNAHAEGKDVNAQRNCGGRITALWYPEDSLTVKFTAFWNRIDAASNDFVMWTGPATAVDAGDANIYKVSKSWDHFIQDSAFLPSYQSDISFYSAALNWNPGSLEIVSATTWSRDELHTVNDTTPYTGAYFLPDYAIPAGLSNQQHDTDLEQFSEEIDISSSQGKSIEWLIGGFYSNERVTDRLGEYAFDYNFRPVAALAPAIWFQVVPSTLQNWAVFGDLTWRITDQLDLTGGLRYDHNDQAMSAVVAGATIGEPVAFSNQYSGGFTTWMATARYHFTPDVMLYGSVGTGSTPGTMNDPGFPPVKADSLISYEAGLKSGFLDGKGMVDLTVYYIDWKDIQIVDQGQDPWLAINGGTAVSKGVELTSSFSPVYALRLGYNAAYTRAEFTRLVPAGQYLMTGYQLPQVPKWGMSVTADYDWSLTNAWHAHVGGACRWIGPQWSLVVQSRSHDAAPTVELPTYSILDVNASIARGPLALEVFARNLEDTQASRHGHFGVDTSGAVASAGAEDAMVQPRTIGVGVEYSF